MIIYAHNGRDVNNTKNQLIAKIQQLPCFVDYDCHIEPISAGLSHYCFKVVGISQPSTEKTAEKRQYFVKSLIHHCGTAANEIAVARQASKSGCAPAIVFQSSGWLVTEYIAGETLDNKRLPLNEKIVTAMTLLAKLHQIKPTKDIVSLSLQELINHQITLSVFNDNTISLLHQINQQISQFNKVTNKVLCHGDLNFSNIIIDQQSDSWLIDFECSLTGCAEFDLAMFIAINDVSLDLLPFVVKQYQQASVGSETSSVNQRLILSYVSCCFLLNGLWYTSQGLTIENKNAENFPQSHRKSVHYSALAKQQFQRFDQLKLTENKLSKLLT